MKDIKFYKFLVNRRALTTIVFCLFFNSLTFITSEAFQITSSLDFNGTLLAFLLLMPYVVSFKTIRDNIMTLRK